MTVEEHNWASITIPIGDGLELEMRYSPDFRAQEGSATLLAAVQEMAGALGVMYEKNALYGGAWREQGWMGNLARIMSKSARLRAMLWRDFHLNSAEDPFTDTLQDLINLCVFMSLNRKSGNRWGTTMADGSRS